MHYYIFSYTIQINSKKWHKGREMDKKSSKKQKTKASDVIKMMVRIYKETSEHKKALNFETLQVNLN